MWEDEMYSEIKVGDTVWYEDSSGATSKGRAMMRGPAGWVIKAQYRGTPQVVMEDVNYLGHKSAPHGKPDYFGDWLYGEGKKSQ